MFTIIGLMFAGMFIGFLLRQKKLPYVPQTITCLIWLLLFLLGIDAGSNQEIINGLHTMGMEALIITVAAILGSVMAAWFLWYMVYNKGKGKQR